MFLGASIVSGQINWRYSGLIITPPQYRGKDFCKFIFKDSYKNFKLYILINFKG